MVYVALPLLFALVSAAPPPPAVAELALLAEYLRLNDRACYKIVKKHDKVLRRTTQEAFLERLRAPGEAA
jgi:hypothetical protein